MNGALNSFDLPETIYTDDVKNIVSFCLERYGLREWRAAVLTAEIHGHLGIYSTLGAKMGIRALEELESAGADIHKLRIVSSAGTVPPVSCLNDGLQVSTGASLGHGQISITPEPVPHAEALFTCDGISFRLRLKEQYEQRIIADITRGVELYGHSPAYWQYVRDLAIEYWRDWDRNEIFQSAIDTGSTPLVR